MVGMEVLAGTSGYSYKEWKGPFYPEKLPNTKMLGFYAEQLRTVEINNTFYRLPKAEVVARWAEQVPDNFVFVIKASQRITHRARLVDCEETVEYLWKAVSELGPHLGPVLFQLPPYFRKDVSVLRDFLAVLPQGMQPVFEFRHESWDDDEVRDVLREANAPLCAAETDDGPDLDIQQTASWGYLRLRRSSYTEAELAAWADKIRTQPWERAFVFFKHEDEGVAPKMALQLMSLFGS